MGATAIRRAFGILVLLTFSTTAALAGPSEKTIQCRKDLLAAQSALKVAQADYEKDVDVVRKKLAQTPDWKAASESLSKAQAEYDTASKAALETVHKSKDYLTAARLRDEAEAKLKAAGTDLTIKPEVLSAATAQRMTAVGTIKGLEDAALGSDARVIAAKSALEAAKAKMVELNALLETQCADDKACQEKKTALDEGQKKVDEAKAALQASVKEDQEAAKQNRGSGSGRPGGGGGASGPGGGGGGGGPK